MAGNDFEVEMAKAYLRITEKNSVSLYLCHAIHSLKFWNNFTPLPTNNWNPREISRIKVSDPEDFNSPYLGTTEGIGLY